MQITHGNWRLRSSTHLAIGFIPYHCHASIIQNASVHLPCKIIKPSVFYILIFATIPLSSHIDLTVDLLPNTPTHVIQSKEAKLTDLLLQTRTHPHPTLNPNPDPNLSPWSSAPTRSRSISSSRNTSHSHHSSSRFRVLLANNSNNPNPTTTHRPATMKIARSRLITTTH